MDLSRASFEPMVKLLALLPDDVPKALRVGLQLENTGIIVRRLPKDQAASMVIRAAAISECRRKLAGQGPEVFADISPGTSDPYPQVPAAAVLRAESYIVSGLEGCQREGLGIVSISLDPTSPDVITQGATPFYDLMGRGRIWPIQ